MAVSRKAMTEGIRTFRFPGTPCERNLTIPQSAALTAPFTQGSRGDEGNGLPRQCEHWLAMTLFYLGTLLF